MTVSRESLLRDRYAVATKTNMIFTWVMVAAMVPLFWGESPLVPLLIWAGVLTVLAPTAHFVRNSDRDFATWYRFELLLQFVTGVAWAAIAVTAMPDDDVHSVLLVAILASVAVASSSGESQFQGLYFAFLVPYSALVLFGYLVYPGGVTAGGLLFLVATAFASISASNDRQLHHRFVDTTMENNRLVSQLKFEHDALSIANLQLDQLAWIDSLTGLANRASMNRRLDEVLNEPDTPVVVAYLDLNGFKAVNDNHGHRIGDMLLAAVAERMLELTMHGELACRMGGDELTVISTQPDIEFLGSRLAEAFDSPFHVDGLIFDIASAIGLSSSDVSDGREELLQQADHALYEHKRDQSGERYKVWKNGLGDASPRLNAA